MGVCCEKMGELVAGQDTGGVSAILPAQALPEADVRHTVEAAPCLVFRAVAKDETSRLLAVLKGSQVTTWIEKRTFINFCPYCGHDWRVPSVAAALSFLTKAEHPAV